MFSVPVSICLAISAAALLMHRLAVWATVRQLRAPAPQALATGEAGTVYLCHPFLVHAAQMHRGAVPRFMAQPPLHPAEPVRLDREDGNYSPVETAIRQAFSEGGR